jgi:hypothetical protein
VSTGRTPGFRQACEAARHLTAESAPGSVAEIVHNAAEIVADAVLEGQQATAIVSGPELRQELRALEALMLDVAAAGEWGRFMRLCPTSLRTDVLHRVAPHITDDESYWRAVAFTWHHEGDYFHLHERAWCALWSAPRPGREAMMTADERAALAALPAEVRIWRGQRVAQDRGWSWTTDRAVAVRLFARASHSVLVTPARTYHYQRGDAPHLSTWIVARERVLAYFLELGEFEVLVNPADVEQRQCAPLAGPER